MELNGVTSGGKQRGDIFSRLVSALNVDDTSKLCLTEPEVVSGYKSAGACE
jgi:hypothetical protein